MIKSSARLDISLATFYVGLAAAKSTDMNDPTSCDRQRNGELHKASERDRDTMKRIADALDAIAEATVNVSLRTKRADNRNNKNSQNPIVSRADIAVMDARILAICSIEGGELACVIRNRMRGKNSDVIDSAIHRLCDEGRLSEITSTNPANKKATHRYKSNHGEA